MRSHRIAASLGAAALTLLAAGCGKSETPKIDPAAQREEALKAAREQAFGTQVKALDKARALEGEINRKAMENVDKAEKDAQ